MGSRHRAYQLASAAACALLVLPLVAAPAHAAAKLSISPTIMELDGRAGEALTEPITVTAEDDALVVELVHADFGFDDRSYEVRLIRDEAPETTAFSTRGWFSLPRKQYRIASGKSAQLPLRIEIPRNTPGGTYLGGAFLRVVPPPAKEGASQVQAVAETGPLLFISVAGGDPPKPAFRSFDVPKVVTSGPIRPDIVVENRGDEFFTFSGTITVSGPGKDRTQEVGRQFVVPGQPRTLRTAADKKGASGRPSLGDDELGFGRYEVRTRLRIEPTGTTLVASRTFWVIPTWMRVLGVLALLVALGSVALLVRWLLGRRPEAPLADAGPYDEDDADSMDEDDSAEADDALDEDSDDDSFS